MTEKLKITYRLLSLEDLTQVTRVHRKAFKDSALTKLGMEPLRRYYEWQMIGPHDSFNFGAFDDHGTLAGFCFAGTFRGSLSGFLDRNKRFLMRYFLFHPWKVFNPLILNRVKYALRIIKRKNPKLTSNTTSTSPGRHYGILSIAVDPDRQGLGVGRIIMKQVETDALQKGFTEIGLTVHPTNTKAVAFYELCGWKRNPESDGIWSGSMTKQLIQ